MKFTKAAAALCALTMVIGAAAPVSGGVFGFDAAINASAADKPTSGTCGEHLTWSLGADGTLTISGTGAMTNYADYKAPWYDVTNIDKIKKVVVNKGVTTIGNYAFSHLNKITEVSLPDSVTKICVKAFSGCSGLANINLPSSLKTIENSVFESCGLSSVTVPNGVETIGSHAFGSCNNLKTAVISDSVTLIDEYAFYLCSKLESVTLSKNIKVVKQSTFNGCSSLKSIVIPDSVNVIGKGAFLDCISLSSVDLGKNVAQIDDLAFYTCRSLKEVTIPASVRTLGTDRPFGYNLLDKISGFTIKGYKGTLAETYATNNGFAFVALDGTSTVKYGDVNKDGNVNDADVGLLQQYLADWKVTIDTAAADVTGDGKVNESDIGLLQQFLADWKVTLGK